VPDPVTEGTERELRGQVAPAPPTLDSWYRKLCDHVSRHFFDVSCRKNTVRFGKIKHTYRTRRLPQSDRCFSFATHTGWEVPKLFVGVAILTSYHMRLGEGMISPSTGYKAGRASGETDSYGDGSTFSPTSDDSRSGGTLQRGNNRYAPQFARMTSEPCSVGGCRVRNRSETTTHCPGRQMVSLVQRNIRPYCQTSEKRGVNCGSGQAMRSEIFLIPFINLMAKSEGEFSVIASQRFRTAMLSIQERIGQTSRELIKKLLEYQWWKGGR